MSFPKIVFGGSTFSTGRSYGTPAAAEALFKVLEANGINTLDTAQIYGDSETNLGKFEAGKRFILDTKVPGGFKPGTVKKDVLVQDAEASIKRLDVEKAGHLFV